MKSFGNKNPLEKALGPLGAKLERFGRVASPVINALAPVWAGAAGVGFAYVALSWPGGAEKTRALCELGALSAVLGGQAFSIWKLEREARGLSQDLSSQLSHDPVTGALSAGRLAEETDREIRSALRKGTGLTAVGARIENMAEINATFGREEGDKLLYALTLACQGQLRDTDFFGRLNGLVFCALLPATAGGREEAGVVMARLREAVSQIHRSTSMGEIAPKVRLAMARFEKGDTAASLLGKAEAALEDAAWRRSRREEDEREVERLAALLKEMEQVGLTPSDVLEMQEGRSSRSEGPPGAGGERRQE